MSDAGWFDDPTGRFGKRWFDGSNWTANVVGASGAVVSDAVPDRDVPYPPPTATPRAEPTPPDAPPTAKQDASASGASASTPAADWSATTGYGAAAAPEQAASEQAPSGAAAPAAYGAPQEYAPQGYPQQGYAPQGYSPQGYPSQGYVPYGPPPRAGRPGQGEYLPGPGLGVGAVGLICVVLSLFAVDWGKGDHAGFLDLSKAIRKAGSSAVDNGGIYYYCAWAGFVLLALTAVLVLMAGVPIPASQVGNTYARVAGAFVAGGAAVLQTVAIAEVFKGPTSPQFGAWLGVVGYLVVIVGFVLGARRVRA